MGKKRIQKGQLRNSHNIKIIKERIDNICRVEETHSGYEMRSNHHLRWEG